MLKKIIYLTIAISFLFAGVSFASFSCNENGCSGLSTGSLDFKASKNVDVRCNAATQQYAASAGHTNGDKAYGITSTGNVVYYTTKTKGNDWNTSPSATDSSAFSSWSSL